MAGPCFPCSDRGKEAPWFSGLVLRVTVERACISVPAHGSCCLQLQESHLLPALLFPPATVLVALPAALPSPGSSAGQCPSLSVFPGRCRPLPGVSSRCRLLCFLSKGDTGIRVPQGRGGHTAIGGMCVLFFQNSGRVTSHAGKPPLPQVSRVASLPCGVLFLQGTG